MKAEETTTKPVRARRRREVAPEEAASTELTEAQHTMAQTGEQLLEDAQILTDAFTDAVRETRSLVQYQARHHPYRTLGAAAGAGFVLGGGLSVRLTRTLLGLGGRLLLKALWQRATKASL